MPVAIHATAASNAACWLVRLGRNLSIIVADNTKGAFKNFPRTPRKSIKLGRRVKRSRMSLEPLACGDASALGGLSNRRVSAKGACLSDKYPGHWRRDISHWLQFGRFSSESSRIIRVGGQITKQRRLFTKCRAKRQLGYSLKFGTKRLDTNTPKGPLASLRCSNN